MKKKVTGILIVSMFVLTALAVMPAEAVSTTNMKEDKIESMDETVGWKWFYVTVLHKDGSPVQGAKVTLQTVRPASWIWGHTNKNGEINFAGAFYSSGGSVEVTAEVGRYEVSTVHSADVTGRVDITLQYYTKSKTLVSSPLLARLITMFPAFANLLNL